MGHHLVGPLFGFSLNSTGPAKPGFPTAPPPNPPDRYPLEAAAHRRRGIFLEGMQGECTLVNQENYGKSPFFMAKSQL